MRSAVIGVIVFGFVLLALSAAWGMLFPATARWTPEKAGRLSDLKDKINNLAFTVAAKNPNLARGQTLESVKRELDALKAERDQLAVEFNSAADTPKTVSSVLKWSGISLAVIGIIGWYAVNNKG